MGLLMTNKSSVAIIHLYNYDELLMTGVVSNWSRITLSEGEK